MPFNEKQLAMFKALAERTGAQPAMVPQQQMPAPAPAVPAAVGAEPSLFDALINKMAPQQQEKPIDLDVQKLDQTKLKQFKPF